MHRGSVPYHFVQTCRLKISTFKWVIACMYRCDSQIFFFYISIGIYCDTEGYVILFCNSNTFQLSNGKSCIISDELLSDISTRSCKRLMKKMQLHDKRKLVKIFGQTIAAQFHSTLEEIIQQWHWAILVLCFQHIQMLSSLNCIQKSYFHDSFPPTFGVL